MKNKFPHCAANEHIHLREVCVTQKSTDAKSVLKRIHGGLVLDIASGTGSFAAAMEQSFTNCSMIVAADTSEKSVKLVRKNLNSGIIVPVLTDGNLLSFQDGTFDTVAVSNSLHHLTDPELVLKEMMRTLAPGGHFIISEMFRGGDQTPAQQTHTVLHDWWAAVDSLNGIVHNPVFTRTELRNLIENTGLSSLEFYTVEDTGGDPFDSETIAYLNSVLDSYEKRAGGSKTVIEQGELARNHLEKHGFTGARALLAVGTKPV